MIDNKHTHRGDGYFTLAGDINSDMVRRVFDALGKMTADGIGTAHILLQSNGGYVSDGICLYNTLRNAPLELVMYNGGAVASIAVTVFLAGQRRIASDTARFMIHKSHATAAVGARPEALQIIAEGLMADDRRTEAILRRHIHLTQRMWDVHAHSDLHLNPQDALDTLLIERLGDFSPPRGSLVFNI
ncbi:ATP-dependent Clp protease proteolytic subunit [Actimicrobium sp. CCC2.4]|uniref:ATP-dependent Clp protease proteolytic subunit n=1 Tax=Actimicrobium sp. CCC2.4 TaxID=3048606 RepID=UPI002AC8C6B2|nr:ATP-dependent Clp protease proteolytic subunit [Actimicrobium sp. CCC2.4]MEB0136968.1 ATP-dependent Clp protease proteolytic subunit [Actimicrobium sp. CCC2.4]WPX32740.1 ATP-dependent Clp protease proteolytic subunit [Actimicrobium sp. CCC2.4]